MGCLFSNETRESAAINICKDLLEEGAILFIHDPKVDPKQIEIDLCKKENNQIKNSTNKNENFLESQWCSIKDIYASTKDSDAVVVLTEWEEYLKINWKEISTKMRKPAWIFDARSILDPKEIKDNDLLLWRIGDGNNNN